MYYIINTWTLPVQRDSCPDRVSIWILRKVNCVEGPIILYPIVQRNRWFANSDVPFQSVTNNLLHANLQCKRMHYIRWMLHLSCLLCLNVVVREICNLCSKGLLNNIYM